MIFVGFFLATTALVLTIAKRLKFPYTVALLVIGFAMQMVFRSLGLETHFEISSDIIYFVLLPVLLYESAFHVNFHQFKLQFKSIMFLATFGLILASIIVAFLLQYFIGIGFWHGLLFGALISTTDPIAVLAIFKELGAPKRLALIAEGESLFNDATAIIAFRLLASFVVAENVFSSKDVLHGIGDFSYVFVGSILFGFVVSYLTSLFIAKVDNDELVETTLTLALCWITFLVAEHVFHLSGIVATVAAGITMGNIGRTKISSPVMHFMEKFWSHLAFLAVSLVFFFTAFDLNIELLFLHPMVTMYAIAAVLIARAISVYVSFGLSNRLSFFKDEPNVPLSWQHVLNWGGLRGVVALVLVYSLPDTYLYKEQFLIFTLSAFLFSLFINGLTIKTVLFFLGLHIPKKEELIMKEEADIFSIQKARQRVEQLSEGEYSVTVKKDVLRALYQEEQKHKMSLEQLATPKDFERSLRLEVLQIESKVIEKLFSKQQIPESVFHTFMGELDMQTDALEYPGLYYGTGFQQGGLLPSKENFYKRMSEISDNIRFLPFLSTYFENQKKALIIERLFLLKARIIASAEAIRYLEHISQLVSNPKNLQIIRQIISEHELYRMRNNFQRQAISREFPRLYTKFETTVVEKIAWS